MKASHAFSRPLVHALSVGVETYEVVACRWENQARAIAAAPDVAICSLLGPRIARGDDGLASALQEALRQHPGCRGSRL